MENIILMIIAMALMWWSRQLIENSDDEVRFRKMNEKKLDIYIKLKENELKLLKKIKSEKISNKLNGNT